MVEPRIVVPDVAGSNPVGHPLPPLLLAPPLVKLCFCRGNLFQSDKGFPGTARKALDRLLFGL